MEMNDYNMKAKEMVDDIFARIDELETKKENAEGIAKEDFDNMIGTLNSKKEDLRSKYETLKNTTDDTRERAKESFKQSAEYFKNGITELASHFKNDSM